MRIIGIDPGKKGGIAVLNERGEIEGSVVMPELAEGVADVLEVFTKFKTHVYLEKAQAMPKNGVCAMFNYGVHFGELRGILVTYKIPHTLVAPATWTKSMHQGTPTNLKAKARSHMAARRLFPNADLMATERSKVPHDGLIDALLIAEYGRRILSQA